MVHTIGNHIKNHNPFAFLILDKVFNRNLARHEFGASQKIQVFSQKTPYIYHQKNIFYKFKHYFI